MVELTSKSQMLFLRLTIQVNLKTCSTVPLKTWPHFSHSKGWRVEVDSLWKPIPKLQAKVQVEENGA